MVRFFRMVLIGDLSQCCCYFEAGVRLSLTLSTSPTLKEFLISYVDIVYSSLLLGWEAL